MRTDGHSMSSGKEPDAAHLNRNARISLFPVRAVTAAGVAHVLCSETAKRVARIVSETRIVFENCMLRAIYEDSCFLYRRRSIL